MMPTWWRLLVGLACVLATPAAAQEAPSMLHFSGNLAANQTRYALVHGWDMTSTVGQGYFVTPIAFTAGRLDAHCINTTSAGSVTFTAYVDGATTSATCQITSGTTCTWTGSVAWSAGARIAMQFVSSSDWATAGLCRVTLSTAAAGDALQQLGRFTASTTNFTDADHLGKYCGPGVYAATNLSPNCGESTAANAAMIATSAATLTGFSMHTQGSMGTGDQVTFEVCKLGVGDGGCDTTDDGLTGLSVTLTSATTYAHDTSCTHNCSLNAGDTYTVKFTNAENLPSTSGTWTQVIALDGVGSQVDMRSARANSVVYLGEVATETGTLANGTNIAPLALTAKNLRCVASAVPGASTTFQVCAGNTTSPSCTGGLQCTMGTGDTTCADTSNTLALSAGDYYTLKKPAEGAGVTGVRYCAYELAGTDAPTATPTATPTNTGGATSTPTATPTLTPPPGCCDVGGSVGCHTPKADYRTPDATPCATEAVFSDSSACLPNP